MMELNLVDFDSELWDTLRGAYGNIKDDIEPLLNPDTNVPDKEMLLNLHEQPESDYRIAFDNVHKQLTHQGSFYSAQYIAMPYLVKIFEDWQQKNNFRWQVLYLICIGDILANDIPNNHSHNSNTNSTIPKEIQNNYQNSIEFIKEKAKVFLFQNVDKIKHLDPSERDLLCVGLLAILGDREAAYIIAMGCWSQCVLMCKDCEYFDEEIDFHNNLANEENEQKLNQKIMPAAPVIAQWDQKSFNDTYIWFSSLLHLFNDEINEKKLSYYYGTYTCPECGKKGQVMELAKLGMWE